MKAPNYQMDLVKDVQPSTASAAGVAQARMNEGAVKAQTTADMLKLAGGTAFGAYKGKLGADFEKQQEALKDEFVTPVVEAGKGLLEADKLKQEGLVFAAQSADAFAASSILEGQDPDAVYQQAGQLFSKGQSAVLKEYEQKITNYENILARMPSKTNEMFARSEKLLKEYIAKMPGMADEFRQSSARILGRSGIESFTTTQAIEAVGNFSAQQQALVKEAQQRESEYRNAFVKSYVTSGLGTDIEALNAWDSGARSDTYENIQAASTIQRRQKALDDSIKAGNTSVSSGASQLLSASTGALMSGLTPLQSRLEQLGVSKQEISSGMFSEQNLNNPKVREALEGFSRTATAGVRSQANNIRSYIAGKIANGEWQADNKARKEVEDSINAWEENTISTYIGDDKTGLLKALSAYTNTPKDKLDMINKNLDVYKKLTDVIAQTVPEETRQMMFSNNPGNIKKIAEDYPNLVPIKELFNNLQTAFEDPSAFAAMLETVTRNTLPAGGVPQNKTQESVTAMSVGTQWAAIESLARQKNLVPSQADASLIADTVSKAAATETVGKVFLKKYLPTTTTLFNKLSPAQKQDVVEVVTNNTNSVLARHSEFAEERIKAIKERNAVLTFKDASGANPLKIVEEKQKQAPDLSNPLTAGASLFARGSDLSPIVGTPPANDVSDLQSALNHIDTALTVRASITGESLLKLRQKFIQDANNVIKSGGSFNFFKSVPEDSKATGARSVSPTPAASNTSGRSSEILEGLRGLGY
jgi:hypothetical protein